MAELHELDGKTRSNLAYGWSFAAVAMLSYILFVYGDRVEILTLIIGLIGGTIVGGIFGVYFSGGVSTKKTDSPTIQQTGDNPTATTTATDDTQKS